MKAESPIRYLRIALLYFFFVFVPRGIAADEGDLREEYTELKKTVAVLTAQMSALERKLEASNATPVTPAASVRSVRAERPVGDSIFHISGYTDVGFYGAEDGDGSFALGHFAPIIHYQYKDLVLLESELAFGMETNDAGVVETETEVEYLALDIFLNDYLTLVTGKFISPIGQFQQNLHPSWINKLASAPIGFAGGDHGAGATPIAEIGTQLRGGAHLGDAKVNYAVYLSNGPSLQVAEEDGELEIEGIDTTGRLESDGNLSTGGRIGFLPIPNLEIGLSMGAAKTSVSALGGHGSSEPDEHADDEEEEGDHEEEEASVGERDYFVYGFDFYYAPASLKGFVLRGEFVRSEVGSGDAHDADPEKKVWEAWYTQASYLIDGSKFEPVVRYGEFSDPHGEEMKQWALGVNYLFSPNVIGKVSYEINDSTEGDSPNRYAVQLAYGF